ncbi:MAG: IS66 family insertion sequence element accessory protein TnpB, partial [Rickettsiaceae bacterium]|nr:IS66 family insertion sequence element accessory protein TnpB [Rickettsiaceae bacterium]
IFMLQVTPSSTIYMASTHIDFRKGTDGLCAICRNQLAINPLDGAIFHLFVLGFSVITNSP